MSDTKSLNTLSLEVMISSNNEHIFIHDLSDLSLHIIFNAWWASMNIGSKQPIAWNNSSHAPFLAILFTFAELKRLATLVSYVSFVIKFYALHQNMRPAQ